MAHKTTDEKLATARALAAAETPEERRAIREDGQESIVTETLQAGTVQTWADGYGVWHTRVRRTCVAPLLAARKAIRDELRERYNDVPREVWVNLEEVTDQSDDVTVVYREGAALQTATFAISEETWAENVVAARRQR